MKSKLIVAIALTAGTLSSAALAEGPQKAPAAKRGEITVDDLIITLRAPRPVAAVDVARLTPKLTLAELRQPLLDRLFAVIEKDPF
jgi:hypothetical protein